jgi:hypothetical protein
MYIGIGYEIINDFLTEAIVKQNDSIDSLETIIEGNMVKLLISGNFKKIKGNLKFDLLLEEYATHLNSDKTLVFSISPVGALSKMAMTSVKMLQSKLEPFVLFKKNLLIVNVFEIVKNQKPEMLSILENYLLRSLSIESGMVMANLEKK